MKKIFSLFLGLLLLTSALGAQEISDSEVSAFIEVMYELMAMDEQGMFDDGYGDGEEFGADLFVGAITYYGLEGTVTSTGLSLERFGQVAEKVIGGYMTYVMGDEMPDLAEVIIQYEEMLELGYITQADYDLLLDQMEAAYSMFETVLTDSEAAILDRYLDELDVLFGEDDYEYEEDYYEDYDFEDYYGY